MESKERLIRKMGMREARIAGDADKWDQLLFASRELVEEVKRYGAPQEEEGSAWQYFRQTLKEFGKA